MLTDDDLKRIAILFDEKLGRTAAALSAEWEEKLHPIKQELRVLSALTRGNRDSLERINARLEVVEALVNAPSYDTPRR